jgi:hypothetical protein
MSFSTEQGYTPNTVSGLMGLVRAGVNAQFGTDYDEETFLGTNFYKYFYSLVQLLQENEVKTSEIVLKLQQYFAITNEEIVRPNTTAPGLLDFFSAAGYVVSVKSPILADAGKLYVAVDVDTGAVDYAAKKLEICTILKNCVPAGIVTQGTESETITLSNSQSFDFKFNPPNEVPVKLKLTIATSLNNQVAILTPEETKQKLLDNINARYWLGLSFEPQRYFSIMDAPWAASVLLEYSTDGGGTWASAVYAADYDEVFTFELADITLVEA